MLLTYCARATLLATTVRAARPRAGRAVVIVTNRDESQCTATGANLQRVGVAADAVLCKTDPANGFKDARFDAVECSCGSATTSRTFLRQDLRTASDSAFASFGNRFIVLPNPMYGSWERNPLP
jgi:predicted secreted acid phosphatase